MFSGIIGCEGIILSENLCLVVSSVVNGIVLRENLCLVETSVVRESFCEKTCY